MSVFWEEARTWERLNCATAARVTWPEETNPAGVRPAKWKPEAGSHEDQRGFCFGVEPPAQESVEHQIPKREVEIVRSVLASKPLTAASQRPYLRYKGRDLRITKLKRVEIIPGPKPE